MSTAFWALERWRPALAQHRRSAIQTRTDLAYWSFTPLVTRFVTRVSLGVVCAILAFSQGLTFDELRSIAAAGQTSASSLPT